MTEGGFSRKWHAEVLTRPPLIAPARQFTYPQQVAGEEDALARGALLVMVHPTPLFPLSGATESSGQHFPRPTRGESFLATCALGFTDGSMPSGVWACPNAREMCAVSGGYAYVIDTAEPARALIVPLKPVVDILTLTTEELLVFVGFTAIAALGPDGLAWQTKRLSWEGLRVSGIERHSLHGIGWDMRTDKEVPFSVNLRDGTHTGGGF